MSNNRKAIIIGSGIAGLATAVRLAIQGFAVSVYEKNSYPGGKLSYFEKDGFHFDAGPSLFTQPQNVEELFVAAGEDIKEYFTYRRVDIACRYFYEDGKEVNAFADANQLAEELSLQLGETKEKVQQYLQQSEKAYNNIGTVFLDHSLHKRKTWLHKRISKALATVKPAYLFQSLHNYNQKNFRSAQTVQLFNRFATYNGSNPYQTPAMMSMVPHLEINQGTYYPEGGMISITNALYRLAVKKRVAFHFNCPVQRIIHHQGKILGIVAGGKNIDAAVVISNADIYFTHKNLLNNPDTAGKLLRQERSSSAVIYYWGISKTFPRLHLHNIFFSNNYRQEFEGIFKTKTLSNDPTVYINITSKMEDGLAPDGMENWFVMVNAPANTGQDWQTNKEILRGMVTAKISRMLGEDITPYIITEETLDPVIIEEHTASYMGSLYGTSSNSKMAAFLRHANFTGTIKGLYFCGGSVHPGGGIPLCLKSARIVSELVAADSKKRKH